MPNAPKRITAYAQYVNSNLPARVREGQGLYNYKELAAMVGLKPTQHFRRHVNHLAASGILVLQPVFTPRGGIENRFMINATEFMQEIQF